MCDTHQLRCLLRYIPGDTPLDQAEGAGDGGERCAQLVADHGDEVALDTLHLLALGDVQGDGGEADGMPVDVEAHHTLFFQQTVVAVIVWNTVFHLVLRRLADGIAPGLIHHVPVVCMDGVEEAAITHLLQVGGEAQQVFHLAGQGDLILVCIPFPTAQAGDTLRLLQILFFPAQLQLGVESLGDLQLQCLVEIDGLLFLLFEILQQALVVGVELERGQQDSVVAFGRGQHEQQKDQGECRQYVVCRSAHE